MSADFGATPPREDVSAQAGPDHASPPAPAVLCSIEAGVALMTWNRPERNNTWGPDIEEAYFDLLRLAARDESVRVIVVTGAGRHFCPGTDVGLLKAASQGDRSNAPEFRTAQTFPFRVPKPIIAAVNGSCAGTGFVQACMADVRFADESARFTPAFARRGIVAEHGLSVLLPRLLGHAAAMEILLSARVVGAEEALHLGLVTRVCAAGAVVRDALDYARDLALHCSPAALALTKYQLTSRLAAELEDARMESISLWQQLREYPDFQEGVDSFRERREPRFAPLPEEQVTRLWREASASTFAGYEG